MAAIAFKYTNKQRVIGCFSGVFTALFFIALLFIIINIGDFWESHAFEVVMMLLAAVVMGYFLFMNKGGSEIKKDAVLSKSALIVGGDLRYPISELKLDVYISASRSCFHLFNAENTFTFYTNEEDDLVKHLLESDVNKEYFTIKQYEFKEPALVMILANSGRALGFNLDTGEFSIFSEGDTEKPLYNPKHFIQTPGYKKRRK